MAGGAPPMVGKPKTAELHPGPGFRLRGPQSGVGDATVRALSAFDTPTISDLMNRLYTLASDIRNVTNPELKLVGRACTVRVYPGDNLMVHKALDVAEPGDVIVIAASASPMNAVIGDLVCTKARHRRIAGFVVDGLVRDLPGIRALGDFPVFARGVTPIGPLHRGPGEINYPIAAGGIVVNPGDVVVGDLNGVVIVPREAADEMVRRLEARSAQEADYVGAVARGEFSNAWVDDLLRQNGLAPPGVETAG
jgi:regulator of RNase E activity RraA